MESFELDRGEGVKSTGWEISPFFQFYFEIIFLMWGEYRSLGLTEDVGEVAILFGDSGKVGYSVGRGSSKSAVRS